MTTDDEEAKHEQEIRRIERETELEIARLKSSLAIQFEKDVINGVRDRRGNYLDPCGSVIARG